ncbi:alpha/beta fold hydrolase [Phyllobacterium bourgognense]|uniref:Pimeloyl-ACP methyl ester carboxylesterase n=1 Tax=Phyllobacterium bourgognense TaxID=314236 RepID=A0A368YN21_9HYPH|nr:alpha/beta hydrolase [Phyllobacterium bourgognense]RCW80317.1 pimeloyl-ACP methyl ester carboxylesterase [Phyllobacterium bourgognense]
MQTKLVKTDEIELATEAFGNPDDPAILLIMGAMASMLWWPKEFCQRLAAKGSYVIRYDNRDTGLSTNYPAGKPEYSFDDMTDDAICVLDGYGISSAHIVGMSMGGMIAQLVALKYPERSRTLTLISTSPVGVDTTHLPGMTAAYAEHSASYADLDWSDRMQVIEFMLADVRAISSTRHSFDEQSARDFIATDYDRARRFESATNHFLISGGDQWKDQLTGLQPPLLVIHGTSDPIFPVEHGREFIKIVLKAQLVEIEGGGHELHPDDWDTMLEALIGHTTRKENTR